MAQCRRTRRETALTDPRTDEGQKRYGDLRGGRQQPAGIAKSAAPQSEAAPALRRQCIFPRL